MAWTKGNRLNVIDGLSTAGQFYKGHASEFRRSLHNLHKEAEKRKLVVRDNPAKGDCMFVSLCQQLEQVLDAVITHTELRKVLVDHLRENPTMSDLKDFLFDETVSQYLDRMGQCGQWGDHIMLVAAANVFQVEIVVVRSDGDENIIEPYGGHVGLPRLFLGFVSEKHYVSLETRKGENMSFCSPPSVDLRFKSDRGLTIEICLGDVTEAIADGIVVPEGTSFRNTGFVATRLIEIDHKYANIREKLVQKNGSFEAWGVYTKQFGKRFKYVICGIVPPCSEDVDAWKKTLMLLYQRIFREAERKIVSVLAVPLLGSGRGGASRDDAIEVAMVSAAKFKGSHVNKVMFVSNDPEVCTQMKKACGCKKQKRPHSGTSRPGEVSSSATWIQKKSGTELISLSHESHEYQDVEHSFMASNGPQQRTVQEIQRVKSITLWQSYCLRKQELDSRDPDVQNERVLWHGTTRESVQSICKNGFNRSFSGKNAAQYGDGVYFARDSSYAADDTYSIPDADGSKYVFQSRVLTGTYTKGEKGMRVPPWRHQERCVLYDTLVNNVDRPELYVVFHDVQAYPEYLVIFT